MDLQDNVGATSAADQEILVYVNGPVTVNSDPIVPHGCHCAGDKVGYLACSCDRFEPVGPDTDDCVVVDRDYCPVGG